MAVITISRQSGSGGNEVARILCERLGYHLFDKSLMSQLAEQVNAEPNINDEIPEQTNKTSVFLERLLNPLHGLSSESHEPRKEISENQPLTLTQIHDLVMAAYKLDNVVIVGRGSQIVLAGQPGTLHVRVIAPLEARVRAWQARENLSSKDAQKIALERDKAHEDFVKSFFDADIRDASHYDLVINTSRITPAAAAEIIIQALKGIPA
ncbi:MAG: cytidylate kinase-like family protein [Anaerolineaceae bacterium]|nr:cytidylate kinase-like family protein [Anaerolineaceae bacterium]